MNDVFIPTGNVTRCREACDELADPSSMLGPSLAMITGWAGRGKTEFARYYATNSTAVYIPPMNVRSPATVLREISFELCKGRPRYIEACLELIGAEMEKERRLVFIDEADLLPISILEMLRNINERYGCPIVLIGEEDLKGKVGSRRRLASRIRSHVEFAPVHQADLKLFYAKALGVDISPEVTAALHRACGGNWRPVLTAAIAIERAMRASGVEDVGMDLAQAVIANSGGVR